MTALSTVDNARQSPDETGFDGLNPVVEAIAQSWQRLLRFGEWTPTRLHPRTRKHGWTDTLVGSRPTGEG